MHWRSDSVRLCPREISAVKRLQIKISCGQERPEVYTPPPRTLYSHDCGLLPSEFTPDDAVRRREEQRHDE